MFDPAVLAEEIFSTLGRFNFEVALYGNVDDQQGVKVYEPSKACLFFTRPNNIVVSIHEMGENSTIQVHLGRSTVLASVEGLITTLRNLASQYGLNFSIDKYRRELTPRDFSSNFVSESRTALTGSTKSSYLKLEGARMIIRHGAKVDDSKHGARARNVNKVFVENAEGERFLMPSANLMAGRAMTRHISKGGDYHDDRGCKITEMATEQMHAKTCASYCRKNKNKLDESIGTLIEACVSRARDIRGVLESLYRNYDKASVELDKQEDNMLLEDDALEEKVNCLKAKLKLENEEIMDRPTCESVVRIIGEGAFLTPEKEMQALNAIGDDVAVEKQAWEDFKAGKLDLMQDPKVRVPQVKDLEALGIELSKVAQALNPKTSTAFSNVLAHLAELLIDGKSDLLFRAVGQRAVDIAAKGVAKTAPEPVAVEETLFSGLPIMNEGVTALESWFAGFDEDAMFEDADLMTDLPKETGFDPEDFDVDDFLVMNGDDFGYNDGTAVDKTIDASALRAALESYVANVDGTITEDADEDDEQPNEIIGLLLPIVVARLEEEGYEVSGLDATEGDDIGLDIDGDIKFRDDILEATTLDTKSLSPEAKRLVDGIYGCYSIGQQVIAYPCTGKGLRDYECVGVKLASVDEVHELLAELSHRLGDAYVQPRVIDGGDGGYAYWPDVAVSAVVEGDDATDGLDDNEEVLLGGEELAPEDILQAKNPAADMKREVLAPADKDQEDDEDDEAYINRLVGLAGVKATSAPRLPQP